MAEAGVRRLYIEALIQTDLDTLWRSTQDPAAHTRWDARFGEIAFVPGRVGILALCPRPRRDPLHHRL